MLSARLATADFDDSRVLSKIPSLEYFKFLDDNTFACLIDRTFVISRDKQAIAVRDSAIYFTDQDFMQLYK